MSEANNFSGTAFCVGQRYSEWQTKENGFILEWDNTAGFILYAFLDTPSPEEQLQFLSEMEICYKTVYDVCFFAFRFGSMPWADCPFSPALYKEVGTAAVFDDIPEGHGLAVTILLIDSSSGELKNIRLISLPHDFSVKWQHWAREMSAKPLTRSEYMSIINVVYMNHTTEGIADCAKVEGNSCIVRALDNVITQIPRTEDKSQERGDV